MPQGNVVINAFTSGELSPRLFDRNDLSKYQSGLAEQLNFLTQKHGGLIRRSGSRFVAGVKTNSSFTRLIDFDFSNQESYALEFGHLYVRFFRDRGRLQHGDIFTVTALSHAAGISTLTIGAHALQVGDEISVKNVRTTDAAYPIGYDGTFVITAVTATTVSYTNPNNPPGAFASAGTVVKTSGALPTEIVTPWTAADLPLLKVTQSADVLYVCHGDYEPRLLSRSAGADSDPAIWSLAILDAKDGPYLETNTVTGATVDIPSTSAIGATITLTFTTSCVPLINAGQGFTASDIGRLVSWDQGGPPLTRRYGRISGVTDRRTISVVLRTASLLDPAVLPWRLGAWSDTTGWPFCTVFHEQRLWFGGNDAFPQTLWASVTGDFDNFAASADGSVAAAPIGTVLDTSAIVNTLDADTVNTIHWVLSDANGVIVPTDGGVFLAASTAEDTITPLTINVIRHIRESAAQRPRPQQTIGITLLPMSADRKVREFVFRVDVDRFVAPDLTILSEHVTLSGLTETALQLEPDVVLWAVRADGVLVAMTYEREEQVVAWSRHILGGTLADADQSAVESAVVVRDDDDDLVYLIVKRTIGGVTVRYVEFIEALFPDTATVEDWPFVDSCLTLDSPIAITAITAADPVVVTAPGHGLNPGDRVRIRAAKGLTDLNDRSFIVVTVIGDTFFPGDLEDGATIDGSGFEAYEGSGTVRKEVQSVTGLTHLAGQTVRILADGATHADKVVSAGGGVTLDRFASIVHVGFAYTSRATTLPLVLAGPEDVRGRPVRADHVVARFNRTLGGKAGSERMDPIIHRMALDLMGKQIPLFTGSKSLSIAARHELDATVTVETEDPLPMNLLGLVVQGAGSGI